MSTRVAYRVPVPRAGSAMIVFEVEAKVVVDDVNGVTRAEVVRLSAGDWEWSQPRVDVAEYLVMAALRQAHPADLEGLGLTDWERDYLRELALLSFRHSRLAWGGAQSWAQGMRSGLR